jgi:hypothetical protein
MLDRLPVAPLAAAVQTVVDETGVSWTQLARVVYGTRDPTRLKRTLGLKHARHSKSRNPYTCRNIGYDNAARIARALDIDPVTIGL